MKNWTNSIGISFTDVSPGEFLMGANAENLPAGVLSPDLDYSGTKGTRSAVPVLAENGEYDEHPQHRVKLTKSFSFATYPITNAQYEQFDPSHRAMRGYLGFSAEDDEAVVQVSWHDAIAFCKWLSEKEGKPYRLPTEAEWEYVAKAGTNTPYWTGETLPADYYKNQQTTWYPDPTYGPYDVEKETPKLTVGTTPPNPWGIYDIHGLVEEWCLDWYGPYSADEKADPLGYANGEFRVSRGGSHSTEPYFLRSANRQGSLPDDKSWLTGIRLVVGQLPGYVDQPIQLPTPIHVVSNDTPAPVSAASADDPIFLDPIPYVLINDDSHGPIFSQHNHCPTIIEAPNKDLIAIWFSCEQESGREMTLVGSRLRAGASEWDQASLFWEAPDRNMTAAFLYREGQNLQLYGALGAGGTWGQMIIYERSSVDSGASWSQPRIIIPDHSNGQAQPANLVFRRRNGTLIVPGDDNAVNGTRLYASHDNGATWSILPGRISGIHAAVAENDDEEIVAFGRMYNPESDLMPRSISRDGGTTFENEYTEFPSVRSGQRPTLLPLKEGAWLLCSFAKDMEFQSARGETYLGSGLFAALSTDGGKTFPVRKLITGGQEGVELDGGAWTGTFQMDRTNSEPKGYLTSTQGDDGMIHLISSRLHYRFNYKWLTTPAD